MARRKVINPLTGRKIFVGGSTYNKLKREGVLGRKKKRSPSPRRKKKRRRRRKRSTSPRRRRKRTVSPRRRKQIFSTSKAKKISERSKRFRDTMREYRDQEDQWLNPTVSDRTISNTVNRLVKKLNQVGGSQNLTDRDWEMYHLPPGSTESEAPEVSMDDFAEELYKLGCRGYPCV